MSKSNLPDYDIAVIGGGASGIYTAWRMLLEGNQYSAKIKKWTKARGKLKIAVFEGSERIGGRIKTAKAPGLPNVLCEIGGMRYVSSQKLVQSLIENKFNLPRHEQTVTDPKNLMMLRSKSLRVSDLSNAKKLPYNFSKEEVDWLSAGTPDNPNTADNFLGYAVEKIFPDVTKYNGDGLRNYLMKQTFNGAPLYEIGFWNLVATQLSHEAYSVAVTTVGYDCLGFNTNSVDAICEYFDFTPGVKYYLLDNGYDSLFWTMQDEFQKAGGEVYTEKWMKGFDETKLPDNTKGVTMQFKDSKKEVTARAIVLAMPQRSLQLLEQRGPVLNPNKAPQVRFMMNSVEPIHLYKMFIAYDRPWWEEKGVSKGRSLTDMPLRQCYYWGTESKQPNGKPENNNSILMVYNDALSSDFWGGLRQIPLGPGDTKTEDSKSDFKRKKMPHAVSISKQSDWNKQLYANWASSVAPKAMIDEMHRQIMLLHGVTDAPAPLEAAFQDWGDDPYGGAVHFWNPGYNSTEILHDIIQPVDKFPCFICGEAYSTNQTWVEGAFQTAELVLRKFDIPEPKWLSK